MNLLKKALATFWVRTSVSLLVPAFFAGSIFLADSYLKSDSPGRATYLLERAGMDASIDEAVCAAGAGRLFSLKLLQVAGVDLGQTMNSGQTPLIEALRSDADLVADFLVQEFEVERTFRVKLKHTGTTAFEEAVHAGRFSLAEKIRLTINELTKSNHPGLAEILKRPTNSPEDDSFSYLRRLGVGPDEAMAKWGETLPLILATEREDEKRIRQLIESGADVQITGPDGNSLLIGAILKRKYDLVLALIEAGAEVNPEGLAANLPQKNMTALAAAIHLGDLRMVRLVLQYGANPNRTLSSGVLPLALAVKKSDAPLAATLIAGGADVFHSEISFSALQNDGDACLKLLLQNGVSPDLENPDGLRLLDQALIFDSPKKVEILIRAGADITNTLAFALHSGNPDLVDTLLSQGVNIDEPGGEEGGALLDYAFRTDNMKLVGILLKHGASLDAVSREGGVLLVAPAASVSESETQSVSLGAGKQERRVVLDLHR